ncbi:MAG: hypothetical protein Q9159_007745, partial [Coniocarpon cinnabarinum]
NLNGLNLTEATRVMIANNPALSTINWPLRNCTNLTITGNGPAETGANVTLSQLESAASVEISNVSALALESLSQVSYFLAVTRAQVQFLIFPELSKTGSILIANNVHLTYVSFNALQTVRGYLKLTNNDQLSGIQSFPALKSIARDLNITGAFSDVQMQPIGKIQGTSYLSSTQGIGSTCDRFGSNGSYAKGIITENAQCFSQDILLAGSGPSVANSSSHVFNSTSVPQPLGLDHMNSPDLSDGDIAGIVTSITVTILAIVSVVFWWLKKRRKLRLTRPQNQDNWFKPELSAVSKRFSRLFRPSHRELSTPGPVAELQGRGITQELSASQEPVELSDQSQRVELAVDELSHEKDT